MGKSKNAVAVSESGIPAFSRLNGESCESCGLEMCLPDHPHPAGMVYHVGAGRFLLWPQIEAMNGKGKTSLATYETEARARQEARRKRDRERARRYYHRKRKREVRDPQIRHLGSQ